MLRTYIAVDLGASSGRVALGLLEEGRLSVDVVYRFTNRPISIDGHLCWDIDTLFAETITGLKIAVLRSKLLGAAPSGIGIDSWGVDYVLINGSDHSRVNHYRDAHDVSPLIRQRGMTESAVFALSGVPDQAINTSTRLAADPDRGNAEGMLFVADLWVYLLTGDVGTEPTIASTSQLLGVVDNRWSPELFEAYELPTSVMPPVRPTGSIAGVTTPEISQQIEAINGIPVYRVGEHDTASAFAFARPGQAGEASPGLISCGTWSVVGLAVSAPVANDSALAGGFANERGVASNLLLRNLSGMWLLQEGLREFSARGVAVPPLADLVRIAEDEPQFDHAIDVADERLLQPSSMLHTVGELCREAGGPAPDSPSSLMRVVSESLGRAYANVLNGLSTVTCTGLDAIHIVGGGCQNRLLCQTTADVTGLPVVAGPVEASSVGNIACQIAAAGEPGSMAEVYGLLRQDHMQTFRPNTLLQRLKETVGS